MPARFDLEDATHRPRWWPPICTTCRGIRVTTNSINQTRNTCHACQGRGSLYTHTEWTHRRLAGLEP